MSKQFSEDKGAKMLALPAKVGGRSICRRSGRYCPRALAVAEISGSDTVAITINL